MTIDLEAIEARLAAATPYPWAVLSRCFVVTATGDIIVSTQTHPLQVRMNEDLALIAHAPADIAALIDEVRRLRAITEE